MNDSRTSPPARARRLALLLGAASGLILNQASAGPQATDATTTAPAWPLAISNSAAARSAPAGFIHSNLTSAATVSSKVPPPSHSEEDIRDIRQPRHLPHSWLWTAVAAGVFSLAAGFAAWRWLRPAKFRALLPHELALEELAAARRLMSAGEAREYGYMVSRIIRRYLEQQFHAHAPRLTTEEFLRSLVEDRAAIPMAHRVALGEFLQYCDFAKFAGWHYSAAGLEAIHSSAETFVVQTAASTAAAGSNESGTQPLAVEPALVQNA